MLKGVEVKSLRLGRATLTEAWAGERDGELYLFNAYIPEYQGGVLSRFEVRGARKLLVKKKERGQLFGAIAREGATVVPLDIHFNPRGLAKVTLGIAEGKQKHDKRHADRGAGLAAGQGQAVAESVRRRERGRFLKKSGAKTFSTWACGADTARPKRAKFFCYFLFTKSSASCLAFSRRKTP